MEQTELNNIEEQLKELKDNKTTGQDRAPALQMEPNKIYDIEVDFSKKFEKWEDKTNKAIKVILPITLTVGTTTAKMVFFLNVKNPLYSDILKAGKEGQKRFKICRTGTKAETRYAIVT